jgi:ParB-like chromosome segregation protein Spo0J
MSETLLQVETVPVTAVRRHPKNYRKGNLEALKKSLLQHGQYAPILVQRKTGYIFKGNHTYRAILELGWETVQVIYFDIDDEETLRRLVDDNAASDAARNDADALARILEELSATDKGLEASLLGKRELDRLIERVNRGNVLPDEKVDLETGTVWRPRVSLPCAPGDRAGRRKQWRL